MSGGSLEYVYQRIDAAVESLAEHKRFYRKEEFVQKLVVLSKALHDVEWYLSGDYGEEQVVEAVNAVLRR